MKKIIIGVAIMVVTIVAIKFDLLKMRDAVSVDPVSREELSPDKQKLFLEQAVPMLNEILLAYNSSDYEVFTKWFTKNAKEKMTKEYFLEFYSKNYKEKYGDYKSNELLLEESSFSSLMPDLVLRGMFSKKNTVYIRIVFIKKEEIYKIFSITLSDEI